MRGDFISQIPRKQANTAPKMPQISLLDIVKWHKKGQKQAILAHFCPILVRSTGIEPAWSYPQDP